MVKGANLVAQKYKWLNIGKVKNGFISFQAQLSNRCPICEIIHEKDQLRGFIRKKWIFYIYNKCYRQKQYKLDHKGLIFDKVSNKVEPNGKTKKWRLCTVIEPNGKLKNGDYVKD